MTGRWGSRWIRAAIALIVLACLLAAAGPASAHTITGTVRDAVTLSPIFDAELQVWYWDVEDQTWYRLGVYAGSHADGTYSLSFSSDGTFLVECYGVDGYADEWYSNAATQAAATSLALPGATSTGIDFCLHATGSGSNLTLTAPSVCAYRSAKLTGALKDGAGVAVAGATVTVEYLAGAEWMAAGSDVTDAAGAYAVTATPTTLTSYRTVFAGDGSHPATTSATSVVLPRVYLSRPAAPQRVHPTTTFTCSTLLKPRHEKGGYPVSFQCQRYIAGKWVTKKTVKAKAADYQTFTKCSARLRLGTKGSWRIRAVHLADAGNAKTLSSWRAVRVN
jgi:hypothetical protein